MTLLRLWQGPAPEAQPWSPLGVGRGNERKGEQREERRKAGARKRSLSSTLLPGYHFSSLIPKAEPSHPLPTFSGD